MGCIIVLGIIYFLVKGDERFYRFIFMFVVMRVLDFERFYVFVVWLVFKDLVFMDRIGDFEILVNENLK